MTVIQQMKNNDIQDYVSCTLKSFDNNLIVSKIILCQNYATNDQNLDFLKSLKLNVKNLDIEFIKNFINNNTNNEFVKQNIKQFLMTKIISSMSHDKIASTII